MKAECPHVDNPTPMIFPEKPKGRSYQMTLNEAREETDVASGTFLVNQITANILFDSRADYSFISHEIGRKLKLSPHMLSTPIMVEIIGGRNVTIKNRLKNFNY